MQFEAIRLREWKAFRRADFEFPVASKGQSVVLIGARNGYGKTSFLEAIIIGLYGTFGRDLVARAESRDGETGRLIGYRQFIERAFNRQALDEGESRMSVEIVLADSRKTLTIERSWYIRTVEGEPTFRPSDEQLIVYEGKEDERRPLPVPAAHDRNEFLQSYIEKHFLQQSLARFFLFDGERVQRLAEEDMAAQVRLGIESLLGIGLLRTLQSDLERLIQDKRPRDDASTDSAARQETRREADELRLALETKELEAVGLREQLRDVTSERERLMRDQQLLHGDGIRNASELNEKRLVQRRELERCRDELAQILERQLPLALVGLSVRNRLHDRLRRENALRQWQGVIRSGNSLLSKFLERLRRDELPVDPVLTEVQRSGLSTWVQGVWNDLHHPPPDDCAPTLVHGYLNDDEVSSVVARLEEVSVFASGTVGGILHRITVAQVELDWINDQLARVTAVGGRAKDLQDRVEAVFSREKALNAQLLLLENELVVKKQALATKEQRLTWMDDLRAKNAPQLAIVRRATDIRGMLSALVEESVSLFTQRIGEEMTKAYRGIAHKTTVRKIAVASDCKVSLQTSKGHDFRSLDNSAGENQIFACALIASVVKASGRNFPIVIDTPLARLDKVHRERLLRWLADHTSTQVIFLSTDTEIVGDDKEAVKDRIAETFLVRHEEFQGYGLSQVEQGAYFEERSRAVRQPGPMLEVLS